MLSPQPPQPSQPPQRPQSGQTYLTKYHLREQPAYALLGPIRAQLSELERRAKHYVARVTMEPEDLEPVRAAAEAIARAGEEVERLWRQSGERYGR